MRSEGVAAMWCFRRLLRPRQRMEKERSNRGNVPASIDQERGAALLGERCCRLYYVSLLSPLLFSCTDCGLLLTIDDEGVIVLRAKIRELVELIECPGWLGNWAVDRRCLVLFFPPCTLSVLVLIASVDACRSSHHSTRKPTAGLGKVCWQFARS